MQFLVGLGIHQPVIDRHAELPAADIGVLLDHQIIRAGLDLIFKTVSIAEWASRG